MYIRKQEKVNAQLSDKNGPAPLERGGWGNAHPKLVKIYGL